MADLSEARKILKFHLPHLRAYALRILYVLEGRKESHPYWLREYRLYHTQWTLMQENLNNIFSELGEKMDSEKVDENFHDIDLLWEKNALQSCVYRMWKVLEPFLRHKRIVQERNLFMHRWSVMDGSLDRMITPNIPEDKDLRFCCKLKCFLYGNESVDGFCSCEKCRASGSCHCDCVMYMKYLKDTHCCPLLCVKPQLDRCLLCPGACLCLCVSQPKADGETIYINRQVMQVIKYLGDKTHCCEKNCVSIPDLLCRGLACNHCMAVNFCKCECTTYKQRDSRYDPLIKPKDGWQAASKKDLKVSQNDVKFAEMLENHYYLTIKEE